MAEGKQNDGLQQQTIADFGVQWSRFTENEGYYASLELFSDLIAPFLTVEDFKGKIVADIGSGSGRIVRMLANAGAKTIVALEPSEAMAVLRRNTEDIAHQIRYVHAPGDQLAEVDLDVVVSFGVLHHIPDPKPVVQAMYRSLKPGGKALVWLYGREGNELYLSVVQPVRTATAKLPHAALHALSWALYPPLQCYILLSRYMPLPMRNYMQNHVGKLGTKEQVLTIYDQLNPAWAQYYTRAAAEELLGRAGFTDIKSHHRHGYSWTLMGTKPTVRGVQLARSP